MLTELHPKDDLDLPVSAWREGQYDALTQIISSDARYLLLEGPTGTGKSVLAVAGGRLLGDEHSAATILVGTKQLQAQYEQSFAPKLLTAMGRANFPCAIDPHKHAGEAVCQSGVRCEYKGTDHCAYYKQKNAAVASPEVVLNYPYWLALANFAGAFTKPGLLVCDEAHLLEDEIRRFATATFRYSHLHALGSGKLHLTSVSEWRKFAASFTASHGKDYRQLQKGSEDALSDEDIKERRALKAVYEGCKMLLMGDGDNWVLESQPWGALLRPVWVAPLSKKLLLQHADRVLFMSATILDKDLFCRQLGLPAEETDFIRMPSTFPARNRPLYYQPVGKVKTSDERVLEDLVESIDEILDDHPWEHGLIHTVSYKLADYIMENSRHAARLVSHDTKTRTTALRDFQVNSGGVLVSPSVTTGVDLPYDACSFQIIAKLAFPDLHDRQIKKRMKVGPDGNPNPAGQSWYNWATACNLVQAYGRGMRAPDDNCKTYLLDANWGWFRMAVKGILPGWFTEAIERRYRPGSLTTLEDLQVELRAKTA